MTYWIEFYLLEPWGSEAEERRIGTVCATLVNVTPRGNGAKIFTSDDFFASPYKDVREKKVETEWTEEQLDFIKRNRNKKKKQLRRKPKGKQEK